MVANGETADVYFVDVAEGALNPQLMVNLTYSS
jgi:hypothetical protein